MRTAHLEILAAPSAHAGARVGVIVPKHKHTAVDRNKLKRRLRELVRTRLLPELAPVDAIIRARPEAYAVSFAGLTLEVEQIRVWIGSPGAK